MTTPPRLKFRQPLGATLAASIDMVDRGEEPDAEPAIDLICALERAAAELERVSRAIRGGLTYHDDYRVDVALLARAYDARQVIWVAIFEYQRRAT